MKSNIIPFPQVNLAQDLEHIATYLNAISVRTPNPHTCGLCARELRRLAKEMQKGRKVIE